MESTESERPLERDDAPRSLAVEMAHLKTEILELMAAAARAAQTDRASFVSSPRATAPWRSVSRTNLEALPPAAGAQCGPADGGLRPKMVPRRVLVIEDNVDAADTLREVLELEGHEVLVAYTGSSGLERARTHVPDVVLCDIGLPGMNGYEVARAIRSDQALRGVFLVAVTCYARPEDVAEARQAGFDEHIAKPATLERLDEALEHASAVLH